jgi:hypothetical protein
MYKEIAMFTAATAAATTVFAEDWLVGKGAEMCFVVPAQSTAFQFSRVLRQAPSRGQACEQAAEFLKASDPADADRCLQFAPQAIEECSHEAIALAPPIRRPRAPTLTVE